MCVVLLFSIVNRVLNYRSKHIQRVIEIRLNNHKNKLNKERDIELIIINCFQEMNYLTFLLGFLLFIIFY